MDYGKVTAAELKKIDFSLPPDGKFTQKQFTGKRSKKLKVYVGCAKWGRPDWIGILYPEGTIQKAFLSEYVNHFNAIELNATHYKIYSPEKISKWAAAAKGKDFLFCPKITRSVSHFSDLGSDRAEELTDAYLSGISAFGKHLGPLFLQLSPKFSPQKKEALFTYIRNFPKDVKLNLELRHSDWFKDKEVREELFAFLEKEKRGTVITDTLGIREGVHMELTNSVAFIRYVGNSGDKSDKKRLNDWVERIQSWIENGIKEIYFFMHHPKERYSPETCAYMIEQLNKKCNLNLPLPEIIEHAKTLFKK